MSDSEETRSPSSEEEFKRKVVERFEELPTQQRQVAEYLLDHLKELPFLSVPELAVSCGVSEATIVRFAQRIGYDGFSGLKTDLSSALREQVVRDDWLPPSLAEDDADTVQVVARQELSNVHRSVEEFDRDAFRAAAGALREAQCVHTYGLGISAHLADLFGYLLTQIGLRACALSTRFSSPLEQLGPLGATDLLVVFSFPPYSKQTVSLAGEAVALEIPCVAITDRITAPVARHASLVLPVRSDNLMYTNAFAAASVLLNALTTEVALQHRDHAARAVSRISRILSEDENVLR
jgi:DNA-binding MurR/RpiR family transcriptional regulator